MKRASVRLVRRHTHAGRELAAGAQLVLEARLADWLVSQGIAEPIGGAVRTESQAPTAAAVAAPAPQAKPAARRLGCCGGRW